MPSTHYVYCSCARNGEILRFLLDEESGRLHRLGTTVIPQAQEPTISHPLALSRNRRFLFAAIRVSPFRIATYRIAPADGSLELAGTAPTAGSLAYVTVDASGAFLLGASLPDSLLVGHRIDPALGITDGPVQVIRGVGKAHSIVLDAGNRFAYAAALGENRVRHLHFDARSGTLSPASPAAIELHPRAGPRHLALDPRQRFLYCLNETDGTIDVLARDAETGALSRRQVASLFAPEATKPDNVRAADIAMDPAGRFLYASERSSSTIALFRIDAESGTLGRIASIGTEASPRGMRLTPSGRLLLVAGELSGNIVVYATDDATGGLRAVERKEAVAGANWIVMMDSKLGGG